MSYKKPTIIAQNKKSGSYAAGCPEKDLGSDYSCKTCERTR